MYDFLLRVAADGFVIIIFVMAMYAFLFKIPREHWWQWAVRIVLAGLTSYAAAKLAGYFYQPETLRPFEQMGVAPGASYLPNPGFPSDHALFAMFLTLAVWFSTRMRRYSLVMLVLTLCMSVARVLALVHTWQDVTGGLLLGFVGIIWYGRIGKDIVQSLLKHRGEK